MRRRTLRLLDAGRAPAAWMRGSERAGARLHALARGTAWAPALAAVRPALREGPLLGGALDALSSADSGSAPSSPADAPAAPPAPPRRGESPPSPRRRAGKSDAPSVEGADDAAPRARTPRERRATAALAAPPHRPRPSALPRRADEGVLRRWSGPAGPAAGVSTGGAMEWDEIVRRAARAALTSSPHALPSLALVDRLAGWRNGAGSPALPSIDHVRADAAGPAFGGEVRGGRWIGTVARRAIRRFLRGAATAGGTVEAGRMDFDAPHRPRRADAVEGGDAGDARHRAGWRDSADPRRPPLAGDAGGIESAGRRSGGPGPDDPRRPLRADAPGAMESAGARRMGVDPRDPHRPWGAEVEEGGPSGAPRLAREWDAPLDGPAAPAEVLARLASGRPRAPARGPAAESARRAPANAATSLLRQARRRAAGGDGESVDGDADAAPFAAPGGRPRGHRAIHVPSLVRALADPAASSAGDPRPVRAVATAEGLLRPSAYPLLASAGAARNRIGGADASSSPEDGRDRWVEWPAVLPWPGGPRTAAAGATDGRPAAARASASAGTARPRPFAGASGGERGPAASPSAAPAAEGGTPRGPIPTAGGLYRPAGPLPPPLTPGPFPPRAAVLGEAAPDPAAAEAARPPAPPAAGGDAAALSQGWGAQGWGAPAGGPHAAGHPFARDAERAAEELDDALARRLKRILDDEARRYGIDV